MTDVCRNQVLQAVDEFSREGLRVLGVAYRQLQDEEESPSLEQDLCFLGLIAMMDPPRVESAQAVASCKEAGIRPVMITGCLLYTSSGSAIRPLLLELIKATRSSTGEFTRSSFVVYSVRMASAVAPYLSANGCCPSRSNAY